VWAGGGEHPLRDLLGQEKRTLQVDADNPVEIFGRDLQHVAAHLRAHPRVLDQGVKRALRGFDLVKQRRDGGEVGKIVTVVSGIGTKAGKCVPDRGVLRRGTRGDGKAEPLRSHGLGDAKTDALLAASDEREGGHAGRFPMWSPARRARAAMVSEGFTAAEVGKTEASTM
jgi:hypothetical protein